MKKFVNGLLSVIFVLGFGVLLGLLFAYVDEVYEIKTIFIILTLFGSAILSFVLGIIIHELGHLVFGLLTGYSFVSYRLFSHIFYRDVDGKIKHKKTKAVGIAGQCLMKYDKPYSSKMPFFWYNIGGGFFNIITGAILSLLMILFKDNGIAVMGLFFSMFISILLAIINLSPFSNINNDGVNMHALYDKEDNKKGLYDQLKANVLLTNGVEIQDVPLLDYEYNSYAGIAVSGYIFWIYKYCACGEFDKAKQIVDYLFENIDSFISNLKLSIAIEIAIYKCIYEKDYEGAKAIFSKVKKGHIKQMNKIEEISFTIGSVVYYAYIEVDYTKALEKIEKEKTLISNHYYVGLKSLMNSWVEKIEKDVNGFINPEEEIIESMGEQI